MAADVSTSDTHADRDDIAATRARAGVSAACITSSISFSIDVKRAPELNTNCRWENVFVYPLKMMGGGEHEKVPEVQGFPVVVRLSTGLQLSS